MHACVCVLSFVSVCACVCLWLCNSTVHRACQNPDGTDDVKKGSQLLEVYALEIQMYTEQRNTKKLKQLYHKALAVKSAIPHPRILGIIRECGGKMHMRDQNWQDASTDFFEVGVVLLSCAGMSVRMSRRRLLQHL